MLPSSKRRYRSFVQNYRGHKVDDQAKESSPGKKLPPNLREHLWEYVRWLRPHWSAAGGLFGMALLVAALQMVEPLFMRFIVDRVLLVRGLETAARFSRLQPAGVLFLALV